MHTTSTTAPTEQDPLLPRSSDDQSTPPAEANTAAAAGGGGGAPPSTASGPVVDPPLSRLVATMSSIWLGTFLAALDSTLLATLTAAISTSFHSMRLLTWLAAAYFVANAALQPLSGKLTDLFGRRAGLLWSNALFAAGNLMCGLATSEKVMVAGRVVAGLGGGGLTAISTFVASDMVPLRRRGVWQGFGNMAFGIGAACGGVYGGWVDGAVGWRWAFNTQVPLSVLSCGIVWYTVRIPIQDSRAGETRWTRFKRIDFLGAAALLATLTLMLTGMTAGGNTVPWDHPLVLTTLPLSVALLGGFIFIEWRVAKEPVIPVKVMANWTVLSACLTNWFYTMALFALIFYVPIYLQLLGLSPAQAGLRLVPQSIGVATGSISTGLIIRRTGKYYMLNCIILAMLLTGFLLPAIFYTLDSPTWQPFIFFILTGLGFAGMLTITLIALVASVDHQYQAVITSASYAFRSTGSTIGIAIAGAVFQNALSKQLWERIGGWEGASKIIEKVRDDMSSIKDLDEPLKGEVKLAYMESLRAVFATCVGLAVLGGISSLGMKEHKLHTNLARTDEPLTRDEED